MEYNAKRSVPLTGRVGIALQDAVARRQATRSRQCAFWAAARKHRLPRPAPHVDSHRPRARPIARYTEYFQWSPEHNSNSPQKSVKAGDTLRGSLVYNHLSDSYYLSQTVLETGATSTQTVKCQSGKKYLVPYIVYEKVFSCGSYPPDGVVTFHNITMECETATEPRIDCKV